MFYKQISLIDALTQLFMDKDPTAYFFYDRDSFEVISDYAKNIDSSQYLIGFWNSETGKLVFGSSGMMHNDLAGQKGLSYQLADKGGPWWGFTVFREEGLPGIQIMSYSSRTGDLRQDYYPGFRDSFKMALSGMFEIITILQKDSQGKYHPKQINL